MSHESLLALEIFFIGLLVLSALTIGGIALKVISGLYKGQR